MASETKTVPQESAKFINSNKESLFNQVMEECKNEEFKITKTIDTYSNTNLYDLDYFKKRLYALESFDDGEFLFANRIQIKRYYLPTKIINDPSAYDYLTKV